MNLKIPEDVLRIMHALQENGHECFIVGGAVRSALLGLPVHDYDMNTDALPKEMQKIFSAYHTIETGLKHGTLTVMSGVRPVEITTYRRDGGYQDHRHPDTVEFSNAVREDCARRDFTVNALCYSPQTGLLDFFNGRQDLEQRIIRAIGNPSDRFDEDALRILRALRFAAKLEFTIEPETEKALYAKKELLSFISVERIREELTGLLDAADGAEIFARFRGIIETVIPEIKALDETQWQSMITQMKRAEGSIVRMAILLTYISVPKALLQRMKYSNAEIRRFMTLVENRDMPMRTRSDLRRVLNKADDILDLYLGLRCALEPDTDREMIMDICRDIRDKKECYHMKTLAVRGDDMTAAGLQGPTVRDALQACLEEVIEDRLPNEKTALMNFVQKSCF